MFHAVLAALVMAACAREAPAPPAAPPPPDPAAVRSAIEAANGKFVEAMNKGDTATAFMNYASDAVIMMSNEKPWRGRELMSKGFGGMMSMFAIKDMSFHTDDVMVDGDLAVETGEYKMTLVPKGGKEMKDEGKYITVWKKQSDGSWKIVRDISNSSLPAK